MLQLIIFQKKIKYLIDNFLLFTKNRKILSEYILSDQGSKGINYESGSKVKWPWLVQTM